jgi:hypothetical protein
MSEPSEPFDEFDRPKTKVVPAGRGSFFRWICTGFRALSLVGRWVAIVTLGYIVVRHALPFLIGAQPLMALKSAVPLIAIGFSYTCLVVTLPRTLGQRMVGFSVGLAFMLWGVEQYLQDQKLVALIDDAVVFFFVVDLAIVIRHNLKRGAGEKPSTD